MTESELRLSRMFRESETSAAPALLMRTRDGGCMDAKQEGPSLCHGSVSHCRGRILSHRKFAHNPSASSNHTDHAGMVRHCLRADWKGRRADAHDAAGDGVSNSPPEVNRLINKEQGTTFLIPDIVGQNLDMMRPMELISAHPEWRISAPRDMNQM
jgi:hypothetical protein